MRFLSAIALSLACAWAVPAAAADVVIGAGFSLSGPLAAYGEDGRAGADIAAAEINSEGGVLGRKLRIDYEDTGADRAKAVAIYRKFGTLPDVAAMMSISSTEFVALNPVVAEVKLPLVSVGSSAPIATFQPCAFRTTLIVSRALPGVLKQVKALKGAKSIAVIYDTANAYTVGEMESIKVAAREADLDLKGIESFTTRDQNFMLQLSRLQEAKPDILYVAATTDEAALIISQTKGIGLDATLIGGAGMNDPRIAELPGAGAYGAITYFSFDASDPRELVQNFVKAYRERNGGRTPPAYAALGYDGVRVIADAVRRAGSTDHAAVCTALGETTGFQGVNGSYSYKGAGDNLTQASKLFVFGEDGLKRLQ